MPVGGNGKKLHGQQSVPFRVENWSKALNFPETFLGMFLEAQVSSAKTRGKRVKRDWYGLVSGKNQGRR